MLRQAGLDVLAEEVLTLDLDAPLDARARQLARRHVQQARTQLVPYATAADLQALDELLDERPEQGVLHRDDAVLRATRQLYVVRAAPDGDLRH